MVRYPGICSKNSSLHLFITLKYVEEINEIRLVKRADLEVGGYEEVLCCV